MRFDFFQPGDSWLHRLDPRIKLLAVAWVFIVSFTLTRALPLGLLFALIVVAALTSRIDLRAFRFYIGFMVYLMLLSAILWSLLNSVGDPLFAIGPLVIRDEALDLGLGIGFRIISMMAAPLLLLAVTRQDDIVQGLHRLGLPHKAAFTMGMAFRLLPTTAGAALTIRDAQRARALELDRGNPLTRMRKNIAILVPLTLISFDMVERMSLAIESRAMGASPNRTYLRELHLRMPDRTLLVALIAVEIILIAARLLGASL